jgi:hypothetical protein
MRGGQLCKDMKEMGKSAMLAYREEQVQSFEVGPCLRQHGGHWWSRVWDRSAKDCKGNERRVLV